jgi:hypothetical protein
VAHAGRTADLASLPPNDLARSPHSSRLRELGAFRADVSGAGPAVYGLFRARGAAEPPEAEPQAGRRHAPAVTCICDVHRGRRSDAGPKPRVCVRTG